MLAPLVIAVSGLGCGQIVLETFEPVPPETRPFEVVLEDLPFEGDLLIVWFEDSLGELQEDVVHGGRAIFWFEEPRIAGEPLPRLALLVDRNINHVCNPATDDMFVLEPAATVPWSPEPVTIFASPLLQLHPCNPARPPPAWP